MAKDKGLIYSIIFAAVAITGALVFLAYQMGGGSNKDLQVEIAKGIQKYVDEQNAKYQAQQEPTVKLEEGKDYTDDDPVLGEKDAPVTMIEFSDYECPFCQRHFKETYPKLVSNYVESGKLKIVFRDLVSVSSHNPWATKEAIAANCAGDQGGDSVYFKYHDLVFQNTRANGAGLADGDEGLYNFAKELGLDVEEFKTCYTEEKFKDEVAKDIEDAHAIGIYGTPSFLINGTFVEGAREAEILSAIEQALKVANQ